MGTPPSEPGLVLDRIDLPAAGGAAGLQARAEAQVRGFACLRLVGRIAGVFAGVSGPVPVVTSGSVARSVDGQEVLLQSSGVTRYHF